MIAKIPRRDSHGFSILPAPFKHHPHPQTRTAINGAHHCDERAAKQSSGACSRCNKPNELA